MRILVTGGAGFIGSHIVERFQSRAKVRVLDDLRSGSLSNLIGMDFEFIEGSVLDRECVREAMQGVDIVFHLAAMISVPESVDDPLGCTYLNTIGTLVILEEAASAGVRRLVFSSSAAIYGDSPATPKIEYMKPEPKSPYAISKLDGELYCEMFSAMRGLSTVSLRYFNVFGPRQNPRSHYAAAVPIFIQKALLDETIVIHGDGEQTRDFVYVGDIAAANDYLATRTTQGGVFNVGYGRKITINELARRVCEMTGSKARLEHVSARRGDVLHSMAGIERLVSTGFVPEHTFEEGLSETVGFYAVGSKETSVACWS